MFEALRSVSNRMTRPSTWFLGLNQQHSFLDIVRSSKFTLPVSQGFLESSSASLINPRHHRIATDQVSLRLSASSITGLDDEAVLTLFTKGFFGGWVFSIERLIMQVGGSKLLPARYSGMVYKPAWYLNVYYS